MLILFVIVLIYILLFIKNVILLFLINLKDYNKNIFFKKIIFKVYHWIETSSDLNFEVQLFLEMLFRQSRLEKKYITNKSSSKIVNKVNC